MNQGWRKCRQGRAASSAPMTPSARGLTSADATVIVGALTGDFHPRKWRTTGTYPHHRQGHDQTAHLCALVDPALLTYYKMKQGTLTHRRHARGRTTRAAPARFVLPRPHACLLKAATPRWNAGVADQPIPNSLTAKAGRPGRGSCPQLGHQRRLPST